MKSLTPGKTGSFFMKQIMGALKTKFLKFPLQYHSKKRNVKIN